MPVFQFNKALGIARDLKVFLNLQSGLTRGEVPDADRHNKQAEALRNARQLIREQRKTLKSKDLEIKAQAKGLKNARQLIKEGERTLKSKDGEILQLKNELRRKEWRAAGESEPQALPEFVIIGAQKCGTTTL